MASWLRVASLLASRRGCMACWSREVSLLPYRGVPVTSWLIASWLIETDITAIKYLARVAGEGIFIEKGFQGLRVK